MQDDDTNKIIVVIIRTTEKTYSRKEYIYLPQFRTSEAPSTSCGSKQTDNNMHYPTLQYIE